MKATGLYVLFGLLCVVAVASAVPGEVRGDVEGEPGIHTRTRANIPPPPSFTPEGEEDPAAKKVEPKKEEPKKEEPKKEEPKKEEPAKKDDDKKVVKKDEKKEEKKSDDKQAVEKKDDKPKDDKKAPAKKEGDKGKKAPADKKAPSKKQSKKNSKKNSKKKSKKSKKSKRKSKKSKKSKRRSKQVLSENEGKFDDKGYLKLNPDVAKTGKDAWTHYAQIGHAEGRRIKVSSGGVGRFSAAGYYKLNPSVKRAGFEAWEHYLRFGHKRNLNIAVVPMTGDRAPVDKLGCSVCRVLTKRIFNFKSHKPGQLCKLAPKNERHLCESFIQSESQNFLSEVNLRVDRAPEPCVAIGVCPANPDGAASGIVEKELDGKAGATTLLEADILLSLHDDAFMQKVEDENAVDEEYHANEAMELDPDGLLQEDDLTGAEFSDVQNTFVPETELVNTANVREE